MLGELLHQRACDSYNVVAFDEGTSQCDHPDPQRVLLERARIVQVAEGCQGEGQPRDCGLGQTRAQGDFLIAEVTFTAIKTSEDGHPARQRRDELRMARIRFVLKALQAALWVSHDCGYSMLSSAVRK